MTLAKVSPGQPLRIPADTFNAFVDAAAAFQATRTARLLSGRGRAWRRSSHSACRMA